MEKEEYLEKIFALQEASTKKDDVIKELLVNRTV